MHGIHGNEISSNGAALAEAYHLLAETMERADKAGIATFVMRAKEYVVAILAENGILRAETLRFQDEVRKPADVGLPKKAKAKPAAPKDSASRPSAKALAPKAAAPRAQAPPAPDSNAMQCVPSPTITAIEGTSSMAISRKLPVKVMLPVCERSIHGASQTSIPAARTRRQKA